MSPSALSCGNYEDSSTYIKYLGIGEYHQIKLKNLKNYALSNSEVVTARLVNKRANLLIRAKKQGLSIVKVWELGLRREYRFQVLTKKLAGEIKRISYILESMGLVSKTRYGEIHLCDEINSMQQLKTVWKLKSQRKDKVFKLSDNIKLSTKFKKILASKVYSSFLKRKISLVKCNFDSIPVLCKIPKSKMDLIGVKNFWLKNTPLKIISVEEKLMLPNYKLKTRLILSESANGETLQLGLQKISGKLYSLISKDFNSFIDSNEINLSDTAVKLSSIATPELILRVDNKSQFSIGSEIPFSNKLKNELYTDWKFAGLKVSALIEKEGDQYFLNINTELSRPSSNKTTRAISSNKTTSRVKIELNKVIQAINITHKGIQNEKQSLSFFASLPILGRLFTSKSKIETYKNIKLFLQLERM